LADLAARNGLHIMALSDHDSTAGLLEMAAALAPHGIELVPAVELSTDIPGSEVHILGYFMNVADPTFQTALGRFREGRIGRGMRMIEKLRGMGMDVSWERVQEIAADASVGRPHVAQHLVEKGYVTSLPEAFDRFIGRNGPAYAEREKLTPAQAVELIRDAGGLAVMAHPHYTPDHEQILEDLVGQGLAGVEVYYKDLKPDAVAQVLSIAERLHLLPTGGSDYHALGNPGEREPGLIPLPDAAVARFLDAGSHCALPRVTIPGVAAP
jgi:predicted metal-dependent phosphoesterase TrpH